MVACSSDDEDGFPPIGESAESTTTLAPATTTESTAATTSATDAAPTEDAGAAALDVWTTVLTAARTGAPDADQLETIKSLTNPETAEQLAAFFPEAPAREITFHPAATVQDDGTVGIDDCIIMNRGITAGGVSNWLIGTASPSGPNNEWIIDDLKLVNLDPCIPRSIAEAAIEGYEAHLDAREEFLNPPDRTSPLIEDTATGGYREFILGLIDDLSSNGQVLYGRPSPDPKFSAVTSLTEVIIIDCQDVNPEYGVYDAASGQRTNRIAPIVEGELDLRQTTMQLEGGSWKASDVRGEGDVQCRTPPLPQTIQVAGG